jgi:hypothetical protein
MNDLVFLPPIRRLPSSSSLSDGLRNADRDETRRAGDHSCEHDVLDSARSRPDRAGSDDSTHRPVKRGCRASATCAYGEQIRGSKNTGRSARCENYASKQCH